MVAILKHTVRRPQGYSFLSNQESDRIQEHDTLMCCHCQMILVIRPGSGTERGWCYKCSGPLCGKKKCQEKCVPFEKVIEQIEAKGRLEHQLERVKKL